MTKGAGHSKESKHRLETIQPRQPMARVRPMREGCRWVNVGSWTAASGMQTYQEVATASAWARLRCGLTAG